MQLVNPFQQYYQLCNTHYWVRFKYQRNNTPNNVIARIPSSYAHVNRSNKCNCRPPNAHTSIIYQIYLLALLPSSQAKLPHKTRSTHYHLIYAHQGSRIPYTFVILIISLRPSRNLCCFAIWFGFSLSTLMYRLKCSGSIKRYISLSRQFDTIRISESRGQILCYWYHPTHILCIR